MTNWLRVNEYEPPKDTLVICAWLREYSNASWEWVVETDINKSQGGWTKGGRGIPLFWMSLPEPPAMTKKQLSCSKQAYQRGKRECIRRAKENLRRTIQQYEQD